MNCPSCGRDTPPHNERCTGCGTVLARATVATGVLTPPPRGLTPPPDTTPTGQFPGGAPSGTRSGQTSATGRLAGPLAAGQAFGRYHIIRVLGVGGMGVVYQAWDEELGVAVAIKVIRPEITEDPNEAE